MTSEPPLVSGVLTVHNGEAFVEDALRSMLSQTYPRLQIIVINDGSVDGSEAVIRTFGSAIEYHLLPNRGPGQARNEGAARARGSFLSFLDQDDTWDEEKTTRQIDAFNREPDLDLVFGRVHEFYGADVHNPKLRPPLARANGLIPGAMMVRTSAFNKVGPFGMEWRVGEWFDWFARAKDEGLRIQEIDEIVLQRRIHNNNRTLREGSSLGEYAVALKRSLDRQRERGRLP
jgi:glycosyltransferase involved in cell wall biosynthesis